MSALISLWEIVVVRGGPFLVPGGLLDQESPPRGDAVECRNWGGGRGKRGGCRRRVQSRVHGRMEKKIKACGPPAGAGAGRSGEEKETGAGTAARSDGEEK